MSIQHQGVSVGWLLSPTQSMKLEMVKTSDLDINKGKTFYVYIYYILCIWMVAPLKEGGGQPASKGVNAPCPAP